MKATLERLEGLHEALISALDANDVGAIEDASRQLDTDLKALRGIDNWAKQPELKLAAERIGRLAQAALMRVHVLHDHARRRAENLAALRGQPVAATYTR